MCHVPDALCPEVLVICKVSLCFLEARARDADKAGCIDFGLTMSGLRVLGLKVHRALGCSVYGSATMLYRGFQCRLTVVDGGGKTPKLKH